MDIFWNHPIRKGLRHWVVPENIHTHTTGGISEFRRGEGLHRLEFRGHGGVHWTGIPKAWGVFRSELPEGEYRFANQSRTVIVRLITEKKGEQSKRGPNVNVLHVRLIIKKN